MTLIPFCDKFLFFLRVKGLSQKYGYQSKYSKAQAIHELIWQLVYGIGWRKGATGTATGKTNFLGDR